jgi:hypothetical protein
LWHPTPASSSGKMSLPQCADRVRAGSRSGPDVRSAPGGRTRSTRRIGGPRRRGGAANLGWPVRTNRAPAMKGAVGEPTAWGFGRRRGGGAPRREREMGTATVEGAAGQRRRRRRSEGRVGAENRGRRGPGDGDTTPSARALRRGGTVRGRGCCR